VEWDTGASGLSQGLYTVQVIVEELDGSGNVKQFVPLDFILNLGASGGQPVCEFVDGSGSSLSSPLTATAGNQLDFTVKGTDPEGDDVEIAGVTVPSWGTMSPSLPEEDSPPVTSTFSGTPSASDVGTGFATYSLFDETGALTQCTIQIDIIAQPTCDKPTLGPESVDRSANTVSNTITDNEGIQVFEFTLLKNFTVASISPSAGYNRVQNTNAYRWVGSGPPPTQVDFTLQAGPSGQGTYFLEVTDACPAGSKTLVADPSYDLGPSKTQFRLAGPNPFGDQTTIEFGVPEQTSISLSVYNLMGQKVATLVQDTKTPGMYTVPWDGQSRNGKALASGTYLLRLQAGNWTATRRVIIVR
jgi:flagellar hook assembly protein FlgD